MEPFGHGKDRAAFGDATIRCSKLAIPVVRKPRLLAAHRNKCSLRALLVLSLLAVSGASAVAYAATDPDQIDEVVVTGTRISRSDNVQSPTPVVDLSAEELLNAAPQGTFYGLIDLPQFFGSSGPQGFIGLQTGSAQARLDLRNLGSQRLLVLIDGRRVAPSDANGEVDVSLIPDSLVKRVETVTGGASASYGSDAVSGAVNYILDTDYTGFKLDVNGGISTYGDAGSGKLSATFGTPFADGSGHFVVGVDYFHQDPVLSTNTNRSWREGIAELVNSPGKFPVLYTVNGATTLVPSAGLITTGPLSGTTFDSAGNPVPYNFGSPSDANNQVGGGGNRNQDSLMTLQNKVNLFTHAKFDFSETTSGFLEAAYGRDKNFDTAQQDFTVGANYMTISNTNPYLTPAAQALMAAKGVTSFQLQRLWGDVPYDTATGIEEVYRFAAGLNGQFRPQWTWTAYAQYTHSQDTGIQGGALDWQNLFAAVDAVRDPVSGQIVCQSTLLYGKNPGCVPINVLGAGNISPAAYNYVTGVPNQRVATLPEYNVGFSTQTPLFSLWSNKPVIGLAGVEARYLGFDQVGSSDGTGIPDFSGIAGVPPGRIGQPGQFMTGGWATYSGNEKVGEIFSEIDAPIVQGKPWVYDLNMNLAVRETHYDPSGPATTYKFGVNYEPIEDVRLRATYSHDIHAPTPQDLYNPRSLTTIGSAVDNRTGVQIPVQGYTLGNSALVPETGDTYTFGVVYSPTWTHGLSVSADYWNIKIKGAIASVGTVQQVLDSCYLQHVASSCALITGSSATITSVDLPVVNNTQLATRGVDLETSYRIALGAANMTFRTVWTYMPYYVQQVPGAPATNVAPEYGLWNGSAWATFNQGPFSLGINARYLDHRLVNVLYAQGVFIDNNTLPSHTYLNLNGSYTFHSAGTAKVELYANVQNATNNVPDFRGTPSYIQIGSGLGFGGEAWEDPIGRYYTAGVRVSFK
ncbi:MAG TPA: TonB-dependent receptor [Steroidobacteraceae bacterium]|jgi:outer membrane receptor protein involved in Fe transport|nr:TonB-dependent receptor [Steroidobacteraceae bacterium]